MWLVSGLACAASALKPWTNTVPMMLRPPWCDSMGSELFCSQLRAGHCLARCHCRYSEGIRLIERRLTSAFGLCFGIIFANTALRTVGVAHARSMSRRTSMQISACAGYSSEWRFGWKPSQV